MPVHEMIRLMSPGEVYGGGCMLLNEAIAFARGRCPDHCL